jgi:sugar lactone lactonase YvrE
VDTLVALGHYLTMMCGSRNQFSLTRAALSTCDRQKANSYHYHFFNHSYHSSNDAYCDRTHYLRDPVTTHCRSSWSRLVQKDQAMKTWIRSSAAPQGRGLVSALRGRVGLDKTARRRIESEDNQNRRSAWGKVALLVPGLLVLGPTCGFGQPVITSQPINETLWVGSHATFGVTVSGEGPWTYQWQLNGTNIPNKIISTVAGGNVRLDDGGPATNANLSGPIGLALGGSGDLFIADPGNHRVCKVARDNIITTVAGNGRNTSDGDGGPATDASLSDPRGVAVDASGNLFIAESSYGPFVDFGQVREVSTNGIISTVAGGGITSPTNGSLAINVEFGELSSVSMDIAGNLLIAETDPWGGGALIYRMATNGIITLIAGGGTNYPGDGNLATSARLAPVYGLAVDGSGNLFIADSQNNRICKVDTNGILRTVAGNGGFGYSGDGGAATNASLANPSGLAVDGSGNLFFEDVQDNSVRKVSANGVITTVAGYGNVTNTFSGDGGAATNAGLAFAFGNLVLDNSGDLLLTDTINNRIRKVDSNGIISTVAGGNVRVLLGDNGAATNASLAGPLGVATDGSGNLFLADTYHNRIRRVNAEGIIFTVAGNGTNDFFGDSGAATNASLNNPAAVALDAQGNLFIADSGNNHIRKVDTNGVITSVAGGGTNGFAGDGGPATKAILNNPQGLALDAAGNLFIADSGNNRVRKVDLDGVITSVAGGGTNSFLNGGGPATNANLAGPLGLAVDRDGNLFIADSGNYCIRKLDAAGSMTTVSGTGFGGYSGDGGRAIDAQLSAPAGLAVDASGNLYIADTDNHRIREVNTNGTIDTVAGNGENLQLGDGDPAIDAGLRSPSGVAVDKFGQLFIADSFDNRIRKVADGSSPVLSVKDAKVDDAGNYQVIVTGSSGSVTGGVATLIVANTPLILGNVRQADGALTINFLSSPGSRNVVFTTTNLTPPVFWQPISATLAGADGTWQFAGTNFGKDRARFFLSVTDWQPWTAAVGPVASSWLSVASSSDGASLVAAGYPGYPWNYDPWSSDAIWAQTKIAATSEMGWLYTSSDSGASWSQTSAPSNYWTSVASSANGRVLAAVAVDRRGGLADPNSHYTYGTIYVSTNSGASWQRTATPSVSWEAESSVAVSGDGTELVATAYYGGAQVYTSTDFGAVWRQRTGLFLPSRVLAAIASSANGKTIVTGEATGSDEGGAIHLSLDAGATWTTTTAPSNVWSSIACSADGTKLVATVGYGYGSRGSIYVSADSGMTWTQTETPSLAWSSVACSQDGTKLVAAAYDGSIYLSRDSGVTWTDAFAPNETWSSVACSGDGNNLVAVSVGGAIYRAQLPLGLYSP